MLETVINIIVNSVSSLGYTGIFLLMFLESSFFPFPSEIIMIPAGYLAFTGEMNMTLAIGMGVLGSIGGALFNYMLAIKLGRPLLHKYSRWLFMTEEKLEKMEIFFRNHGEISTFVGRLIPGVRQYISFPAGLAVMKLPKFCFYTGLGAGIWVTILTWIGYSVGENQELVKEYSHQAIGYILLAALIVSGIYIWYYRKCKIKNDKLKINTHR